MYTQIIIETSLNIQFVTCVDRHMSKIGRTAPKSPSTVVLRTFLSAHVNNSSDIGDNKSQQIPSSSFKRKHKLRQLSKEAERANIDLSDIDDNSGHLLRVIARTRYVKQAELILPQIGTDMQREKNKLENLFKTKKHVTNPIDIIESESEEEGDFLALDAHNISAVNTNVKKIAQLVGTKLLDTAGFYLVKGCLGDLLSSAFLRRYIIPQPQENHKEFPRYRFQALSYRTELDHTNVVAITPRGILIMLIDQSTYECLGLRGIPATKTSRRNGGKQHKSSEKWFRIMVDLRSEVCSHCYLKFYIFLAPFKCEVTYRQ